MHRCLLVTFSCSRNCPATKGTGGCPYSHLGSITDCLHFSGVDIPRLCAYLGIPSTSCSLLVWDKFKIWIPLTRLGLSASPGFCFLNSIVWTPPPCTSSIRQHVCCCAEPIVVAALTVTPGERMVEDQAYLQVVSGLCPTVGLLTGVRTRFRCP